MPILGSGYGPYRALRIGLLYRILNTSTLPNLCTWDLYASTICFATNNITYNIIGFVFLASFCPKIILPIFFPTSLFIRAGMRHGRIGANSKNPDAYGRIAVSDTPYRCWCCIVQQSRNVYIWAVIVTPKSFPKSQSGPIFFWGGLLFGVLEILPRVVSRVGHGPFRTRVRVSMQN